LLPVAFYGEMSYGISPELGSSCWKHVRTGSEWANLNMLPPASDRALRDGRYFAHVSYRFEKQDESINMVVVIA